MQARRQEMKWGVLFVKMWKMGVFCLKSGKWRCFCKKWKIWGLFFVKSGPFLNAVSVFFILRFTYLGGGGAYAPNAPHPRCLRACQCTQRSSRQSGRIVCRGPVPAVATTRVCNGRVSVRLSRRSTAAAVPSGLPLSALWAVDIDRQFRRWRRVPAACALGSNGAAARRSAAS